MVDSTDDPNIFNTHGSESKVDVEENTSIHADLRAESFIFFFSPRKPLESKQLTVNMCVFLSFRHRETKNLPQT